MLSLLLPVFGQQQQMMLGYPPPTLTPSFTDDFSRADMYNDNDNSVTAVEWDNFKGGNL
jgi:hypothetical protein